MPLFLAWSLGYSWALGWALLDLCMCLLVSVMAWASPATLLARVLTDVLKPPYAVRYNAMKQKALEATQALILLDAIVSAQGAKAAASSN